MKLYNFLALIMCALVALPAMAKVTSTVSTAYSSSLQKEKIDRSQDMDLSLGLAAPISTRNSLSISASANKNLKDERKFSLQDPFIGHSFRLNKEKGTTNISIGERIYFPVSDESKKNSELRTRLSAGPSLKTDLSEYIRGLNLNYRIYGDVFFNKYETAVTGTSNSHYLIGNRFIVDYAFNDKFSLGLDNLYSRSYTYQNNTKDTFVFDQSIGYAATAHISLAIGHNNSGNALAIDGRASNVDIYNERTSTVYLAAEIVF
jgi:hypothetical protein